MSQTKHEIVSLLAEAGTEPRHRFGQNFMIDQNLVRIVADAGRVAPGDVVIEVGPGTGTLTEELLARVSPGGRVVSVEIDRDLAGLIRARFAGRDDFTLIEGDALAGKHQLNAELLSIVNEYARLSPPSVLRGRVREGFVSTNAAVAPSVLPPGPHDPSEQSRRMKAGISGSADRGRRHTPSPGTPGEGGGEGLGRSSADPHPDPLPEYREREPEDEPAFVTCFRGSTEEGSGLPPIQAAPAIERNRGIKLVANLPYNIASPLVIELLIAGVGLLAFTVQKEVADRLRAPAGSDDYGPLSVMAQLLSRVQVLRTLPPQAFWPAPNIDSALVCLTRDDRLGQAANPFGAFVHKLFSFRRKTLRKALAQAGFDAPPLLAATGFDGQLRPEAFTPEQFLSLYWASGPPACPGR